VDGDSVGGDIDTQYLKQKVTEEDEKKIDEHRKERLHYNVLDKCNGWSRAKLWWMTIVCMMASERGEYDTPKENTGKVKDPSKVDGGNTREESLRTNGYIGLRLDFRKSAYLKS